MLRRLAVAESRRLATLAKNRNGSLYEALQKRSINSSESTGAENASQLASYPVLLPPTSLPANVVIDTIRASLGSFHQVPLALQQALDCRVIIPSDVISAVLDDVPALTANKDDRRQILRLLVQLVLNEQASSQELLNACLHHKAFEEALLLFRNGCYDNLSIQTKTIMTHMHCLTEFSSALPKQIELIKVWKLFMAYFVHGKRSRAPQVALIFQHQYPFIGSPTPEVVSKIALDMIRDNSKDLYKIIRQFIRCALLREDWYLTPAVYSEWLDRFPQHHSRSIPLLLDTIEAKKLTNVPSGLISKGLRYSFLLCDWNHVAAFQALGPVTNLKLSFLQDILSNDPSLLTNQITSFALDHHPEPHLSPFVVQWLRESCPSNFHRVFMQEFGPKLMTLLTIEQSSFPLALEVLELASALEDVATLSDMFDIYFNACKRRRVSPLPGLVIAQANTEKLTSIPLQMMSAALEARDYQLVTELYKITQEHEMGENWPKFAAQATAIASTPADHDMIHAFFIDKDETKTMDVFNMFVKANSKLSSESLRHFALNVMRQHDMVSLHEILDYAERNEVPLSAEIFTVCFTTHRREKQDPSVFLQIFNKWVELGLVEDNAIVYHAAIHGCMECGNIDLAWSCVENADVNGILLDQKLLNSLVREANKDEESHKKPKDESSQGVDQ
ncbi:hypothetical protein THRCLA_00090 [Thraustotheca clavata]|uniref:Uncharacterized protein n=1 Tax=Thraustotheca clavata TaxID=74557 RepID=A0A1W0AC73_9STRA|nr:hypothetical protein THRCLA_00090 [Thraustotheca clavata]